MLALGLWLVGVSTLRAQPRDPSLEWRTIRTDNFVVHYYVPLGRVARRVATVAERAHSQLAEILGYAANNTTHILLTDDSDFANGSATALPFNAIRLFASAPDDISPLTDYDDWLTTPGHARTRTHPAPRSD